MSEETFAAELEKEKNELRDLLAEIHHSVGTKDLLKSKADTLYTSIISLPMTRAMAVLKRNSMDSAIDHQVKKAVGEEKKEEGTSDSDGRAETNEPR